MYIFTYGSATPSRRFRSTKRASPSASARWARPTSPLPCPSTTLDSATATWASRLRRCPCTSKRSRSSSRRWARGTRTCQQRSTIWSRCWRSLGATTRRCRSTSAASPRRRSRPTLTRPALAVCSLHTANDKRYTRRLGCLLRMGGRPLSLACVAVRMKGVGLMGSVLIVIEPGNIMEARADDTVPARLCARVRAAWL